MRPIAMPPALILALAPMGVAAQDFDWGPQNTDFPPAFREQFRAPLTPSDVTLNMERLAGGLEHPWGIATLPGDAGWLVTERPGRLRHLAPDGTLSPPLSGTPEVLAARQGGLLDVALAPDFASTREVYLTYAKPVEGGSATAAARGVLAKDLSGLADVKDIFVQAPASRNPMHFGSRVVFLADGTVAVTTGEHSSEQERLFAQDLDKTYGKVIRVNRDGSVPADNPFVGVAGAIDTIWSLGHRNIQGAAVDADGTLWTIEHGPKGGDELNRPEPGLNYGWPVISYGERYRGGAIGSGDAVREGLEQPVYFWDPVIAPGGMAFHAGAAFGDWNGDILASSLNPGGVVRLSLDDGVVVEEERLLRDVGRVRDIEVLADGSFLVLIDSGNGSVLHVTPGG
ncbi:PQQ-dependent sugar dehydrogenase [Jannaschia sp. M317]|uniref:PQQ-dependent sugar dehydrogenase n=1 Tax=Jannaschia sp. M317 TaxID=2867011 RepID=UPI0021A526EB|nr:PQQ-dependent sugar dehydrogenase [Jannaschia sp. M317]UWQ16262.1 PQQ-dependent sugar dehydrogenase [Jannaschia sp. M317]